jgi:hypothetical protein
VALGRRPISRDPRSLSILPLEATRIGETMPRNVAYKLIEESRLAQAVREADGEQQSTLSEVRRNMKPRRMLPAVAASLFLMALPPSRAAEPPPRAEAVLDARAEKVWDAAVASLRDAGYRISKERRSSGFVSGQLGRTVTHTGDADAFAELRRISRFDESIPDVRRASEYRVILNVEVHPAEAARTHIEVRGQIVAVERTRGRRGMPRPIPLVSRGVMEADLLQHIRERLGLAPKTSTGARWLDSPTVDEPVLLALAGHERHEITGLGHLPSCRRAVNQVSPLAASVDELIRPEILYKPHADAKRPIARYEVLGSKAEDYATPGERASDGKRQPWRPEHPLPLDLADLSLEEVHRRAAEEVGDESIRGTIVNVRGTSDLVDPATVDHHDSLRERHRLRLIVRDVERGDGEAAVELDQLESHTPAQPRIEVGERLVEEKEPRPPHDRAPDRHPLPLPAG